MTGSTGSTGSTGAASRRTVVGGILGAGVGVPLLAACGGSAGSGSGAGGGTATPPKGAIAKTSDIPVGGGKIFDAQAVVVTQPTQGDFKAFSAVCTHQGCVVAEIKGGDIDCNCHGSKFSIKDGSVVQGPATQPLQALKATVTGTDITVTG